MSTAGSGQRTSSAQRAKHGNENAEAAPPSLAPAKAVLDLSADAQLARDAGRSSLAEQDKGGRGMRRRRRRARRQARRGGRRAAREKPAPTSATTPSSPRQRAAPPPLSRTRAGGQRVDAVGARVVSPAKEADTQPEHVRAVAQVERERTAGGLLGPSPTPPTKTHSLTSVAGSGQRCSSAQRAQHGNENAEAAPASRAPDNERDVDGQKES
jgi:hypothetical protein